MTSISAPSSITGMGAITCVGVGVQQLWQAALANRSGVRDGLGWVSEESLQEIRRINQESFFNASYQKMYKRRSQSKAIDLAVYALNEALTNAGINDLKPDDGLIIASTTGQIPVWEKVLTGYLKGDLKKEAFDEQFHYLPFGTLMSSLCEATDFSGRTAFISSACSAATQALAIGDMWIRQGLVKRCFVGGVEVLCDLTIQGFRSLQLLSNEPTRPFDRSRVGINISEGSAFFCLEPSLTKKKKLALITGHGMSSDGYHMTAPQPDGQGSFKAMNLALKVSGIGPDEVSWVHAHGTGSRHNDSAEGLALMQLFANKMPWVTSTKWVHGHSLGASGAIEAILCVEALQKQIILNTPGFTKPDLGVSLRHPKMPFSSTVGHVLKNTLGFGGANAALVFSHPETD